MLSLTPPRHTSTLRILRRLSDVSNQRQADIADNVLYVARAEPEAGRDEHLDQELLKNGDVPRSPSLRNCSGMPSAVEAFRIRSKFGPVGSTPRRGDQWRREPNDPEEQPR